MLGALGGLIYRPLVGRAGWPTAVFKMIAIRSAAVWACTAIAVAGLSTPVFAQGTASPAQIDQRFKPRQEEPSVGPPIAVPTPQQRQPEAQAGAALRFTLSSISFTGNTVLPEQKLQGLAASYIGKEITLDQVNELADKVTAAYRHAVYILVLAVVPSQRIADGHLTISIVEGFVDDVKIEGNAGGAQSLLQAYGRRIAAQRPLTDAVLERELLLATDISGMGVRNVLTPSATPGAADLTLVVAPKKVDAYVSVDNRGSKYLGPYEVMGGVFFNDAFGTAGRFGLNAVVTPDSGPDLAYGAMSFDLPVGTDGLHLFNTASYTLTEPGSDLRSFDTKGNALNLESTASYPIIRSRDLNLTASGGFSFRDVRSSNAAVQRSCPFGQSRRLLQRAGRPGRLFHPLRHGDRRARRAGRDHPIIPEQIARHGQRRVHAPGVCRDAHPALAGPAHPVAGRRRADILSRKPAGVGAIFAWRHQLQPRLRSVRSDRRRRDCRPRGISMGGHR